jgi:site-specific recombinase XerD
MAHALAVRHFFDWCEQRGLRLQGIRPTTVAAYIEQMGTEAAKPTVKQHLPAIRQPFDYLVTGGILPSNPAGPVWSRAACVFAKWRRRWLRRANL